MKVDLGQWIGIDPYIDSAEASLSRSFSPELATELTWGRRQYLHVVESLSEALFADLYPSTAE